MLKCAEYSVVTLKSLPCKDLRSNDYSAVTCKSWLRKEMWRIGIFWGGVPVCALRR
jgi:hypothetical protein